MLQVCRQAAVALVVCLCAVAAAGGWSQAPGTPTSPARQLEDAIQAMEARGDFQAAVAAFERLSRTPDRTVAARALLYLGLAYEQLGRAEARNAYRTLIDTFADQPALVARARAQLAALDRAAATRVATPTVRRVSNPEAPELIGPPSRDGRYAPAMDWTAGVLVITTLATGQIRAVTPKPAPGADDGSYAGTADFSPDGSRVVYSWYTPAPGKLENGEIWVARVNGTGRVRLHRGLEEHISLGGWTPDGTQVLAALHSRDRRTVLALIDVRDGRPRVLKSFDRRLPQARLSPDGRLVAYDQPQRPDALERAIHVLDVASLTDAVVTTGPSDSRSPIWLPDSRRLLCTSTRAGSTGAWMLPIENGREAGPAVLLKGDLGRAQLTGVTDEGSIFYSLQTGLPDIFTSILDPAAGTWSVPAMLPARIEGANQLPAFSPDGRFLAFISRRSDASGLNEPRSQTLVIHDLRTAEERTFLPDASFPIHPQWSPDGRSIAFVGNIQTGLYRLDVASGRFSTLVEQPRGLLFGGRAEWAPDGQAIYYSVGGVVHRYDLEAETDAVVYGSPDGPTTSFVLQSRDGQSMAFTKQNGAQHELTVATSSFALHRVLVASPHQLRAVAWSQDDRSVIYLQVDRGSPEMTGRLWRVPAAGGTPEPVGHPVRGAWTAALSPDGARAAYSVGVFVWETWVLEHVIPPRVPSAKPVAAKTIRK